MEGIMSSILVPTGPVLVHLTARIYAGPSLVADWREASRLWHHLRRGFPAALGTVLMPSHLHLVSQAGDARGATDRLSRILAGLRGATPAGRAAPRWEPVPPAGIIPDRHHLQRQLRYLALNPCRAGLVRDPLEWVWSTHRDVIGAIVDPWVDAGRVAAALGTRGTGFVARYHEYVTSDPSCCVTGTELPRAAPASAMARFPLARIALAAAAATRELPSLIRRRTPTRDHFLRLCERQGWHSPRLLADVCGVTPQAVWLRTRAPGHGAGAAELCLGDDRLCAGVPDDLSPRRRIV
jgi:hypothetical protein